MPKKKAKPVASLQGPPAIPKKIVDKVREILGFSGSNYMVSYHDGYDEALSWLDSRIVFHKAQLKGLRKAVEFLESKRK